MNEERCNWDVILGVFGNALKGKIIPMFSCLPTASCIEILEVNLNRTQYAVDGVFE